MEENSKTMVRSTLVSPDEEVWLKDRITTAIEMALQISNSRKKGADDLISKHAIDGIINGTVLKIIYTLGLDCEYINLRQ